MKSRLIVLSLVAQSLFLGGCNSGSLFPDLPSIPATPFTGALVILFAVYFLIVYLIHLVFKNPVLQVVASSMISLILAVGTILISVLKPKLTHKLTAKTSLKRQDNSSITLALLLAVLVFLLLVAAVTPFYFGVLAPQVIIPIVVLSISLCLIFILFKKGLNSTHGVFVKMCYYTSSFLLAYELSIFVRSML